MIPTLALIGNESCGIIFIFLLLRFLKQVGDSISFNAVMQPFLLSLSIFSVKQHTFNSVSVSLESCERGTSNKQ